MNKRILGLCLVLCFTPAARAGVSTLSLVPQEPGPYPADGRSVVVDVFFNNNEGQDIYLRQLTLDFSATDPALGLPALFYFQLPGYISPYSVFETMPKVDMVYTSGSPGIGMWSVPEGASHHVGFLDVTLPETPGTYTLDAINASAPDTNAGAFFAFNFEPRVNLHHTFGNLSGGTLDLTVVPEPATLALLGVGVLVLLRGRDAWRKHCSRTRLLPRR